MSTRLNKGGRLIDRSKAVEFTFNGKTMRGYAGDTLAAALLANDQMLVGRSFKYHRPRGIVASGAEEPNALINMGRGGRFEPNQRATTTEVFAGLEAASQNHWPSLEFDIGGVNNLFARFLPGGFYYKTFMYPRARPGSMCSSPSSASRQVLAKRPKRLTLTAMSRPMPFATFWLRVAAWRDWRRLWPPGRPAAK